MPSSLVASRYTRIRNLRMNPMGDPQPRFMGEKTHVSRTSPRRSGIYIIYPWNKGKWWEKGRLRDLSGQLQRRGSFQFLPWTWVPSELAWTIQKKIFRGQPGYLPDAYLNFEGFEIWIFRVEQICPAPLQWLQGNPRVKQIFYRYLVGGLEHFLFFISYMWCHPKPIDFHSIIFQDGYTKPPTRYQFPMSPGFPWISNGPGWAHQTGRPKSAEIQVRATPRRNAADGRTPGATCVGPGVLRAEVRSSILGRPGRPGWGDENLLPCPYAPCNYGRFTYKTGWFLGQFCR